MKKVVVVGAGIGGLVAAGLLARRGHHVTVLERSPILGGRSHVMTRDGFTLPYGAHALLSPKAEPMGSIFRELGIAPKMHKLSFTKFKLFSNGQVISSPLSTGALTSPAIDGLFNHLLFFKKFLQMVKAKPAFDEHDTVQQWLDQNVKEPSMANVMRAYAKLTVYDGALDRYTMNAFLELSNCEYSTTLPLAYVGFDALMEQLKAAIVEKGGEVHCGCEVSGLVIQDGKITGVATGDRIITADEVILNLPPQTIGKLVRHPQLNAELHPFLRQPAQHVYVYDVMLKKRIRKDITNLLDLDESVYVNDYSLNIPSSAPAGAQLLTILRFLSEEEQQDDGHSTQSQQSVERILDSVYTGWRDQLVGTRIVKRAIVNSIARRPGHRLLPFASKSVESLYFVGDSTAGRGNLSLTAYDSAWAVADLISNASQLNQAINA